MWIEELKKAGVNVHVIATGAGAGLQQLLWQTPGSSAYLSGASFPYYQAETDDLLGFTPDHFVSQETAIDLASAAYMKAFNFGGKKPVGIGITASVASETAHRGEHRFNACVITDDKVITDYVILDKGVGFDQRCKDGKIVDMSAFMLMFEALGIGDASPQGLDASDLARARFLKRPFFTMDGKRHEVMVNSNQYALMAGAFNPPHEGHFGIADSFQNEHGKRVVFEVTATPPHKAALTVQDLLKRAKMLKGRDRLFSTSIPMYIDKARAYPGMPLLLGADAMDRMLDPKWGTDKHALIEEFHHLDTKLYVAERLIGDKVVDFEDIISLHFNRSTNDQYDMAYDVMQELVGRWDVSSTELRNKIK